MLRVGVLRVGVLRVGVLNLSESFTRSSSLAAMLLLAPHRSRVRAGRPSPAGDDAVGRHPSCDPHGDERARQPWSAGLDEREDAAATTAGQGRSLLRNVTHPTRIQARPTHTSGISRSRSSISARTPPTARAGSVPTPIQNVSGAGAGPLLVSVSCPISKARADAAMDASPPLSSSSLINATSPAATASQARAATTVRRTCDSARWATPKRLRPKSGSATPNARGGWSSAARIATPLMARPGRLPGRPLRRSGSAVHCCWYAGPQCATYAQECAHSGPSTSNYPRLPHSVRGRGLGATQSLDTHSPARTRLRAERREQARVTAAAGYRLREGRHGGSAEVVRAAR